MFANRLLSFCTAFLCATLYGAQIAAPATSPPKNSSSSEAQRAKLVALQDDFIETIKANGFQPSLAAPTIVLDNPPSYGNYEDESNVLHIAVWAALSPEQQARFARLAGLLAEGKTGEETFEDGVHHWVFIHELSHWWQACQHKTSDNHYSVEYGANRIAAAYWRSKDPAFMRRTEKKMRTVIATMTQPVPEGKSPEKYFNENYEKLGPTPAYIWFQYSMVLKVQSEAPLPSLHQTLQQPTYP
jgi:hypothetical protein